VAPHVSQVSAIRALLAHMPDVLTGTANQMQGLERPAVVTLHPLAGYREPGGFSADPGSACVMLTRHRAHLTVITDPLAMTASNEAVIATQVACVRFVSAKLHYRTAITLSTSVSMAQACRSGSSGEYVAKLRCSPHRCR
jgi:hypothetical protein